MQVPADPSWRGGLTVGRPAFNRDRAGATPVHVIVTRESSSDGNRLQPGSSRVRSPGGSSCGRSSAVESVGLPNRGSRVQFPPSAYATTGVDAVRNVWSAGGSAAGVFVTVTVAITSGGVGETPRDEHVMIALPKPTARTRHLSPSAVGSSLKAIGLSTDHTGMMPAASWPGPPEEDWIGLSVRMNFLPGAIWRLGVIDADMGLLR